MIPYIPLRTYTIIFVLQRYCMILWQRRSNEDADLVVETRIHRTLRSRQLQHGWRTVVGTASAPWRRSRPQTTGQRWPRRCRSRSGDAKINVCSSGAVDVGRCRESTTTAAVVVQVPVQLMSNRLAGSAGSALLFCLCMQNYKLYSWQKSPSRALSMFIHIDYFQTIEYSVTGFSSNVIAHH